MSPTITLDPKGFNASVARLRTVNKRETVDFWRRIAKECLKYLVRLTPPFTSPPTAVRTETFGTQYKAGKDAVERDIKKGFEPMNRIDLLRAPTGKLGLDIQKLIRKGRLAEASELARSQGIRFSGFIDRADGEAHKRLRNRRGRITTRNPFVVIKSASVNQRIKKVQARVGYAKAGWMAAARALKLSLPGWISRHNTPGLYREAGAGGVHFRITMANKVKYGVRFETSIVPKALEFLKGSVEAQYVKLINLRHKRKT